MTEAYDHVICISTYIEAYNKVSNISTLSHTASYYRRIQENDHELLLDNCIVLWGKSVIINVSVYVTCGYLVTAS